MAGFNRREHAYVAQAFDPSNFPRHKLAESQVPTKESSDVYGAATSGDVERLKSALAAGGNPNWYNHSDEGATALHKAAEGGHVGCIEVLLKSGAVIDERLLTSHNSPLHLACAIGHLDVVKQLLSKGAPVNSGNSYGNAPIHGALIRGHREIVELLLEKGVDARWTNNKGSTLLHFLVYSPMEDGDSQAIGRKLIEAGVNVDAKNMDGMTPLHVVARGGNATMAAFLLDNGADRTIEDTEGKTALRWAQLNTHTAVGLLLTDERVGSRSLQRPP